MAVVEIIGREGRVIGKIDDEKLLAEIEPEGAPEPTLQKTRKSPSKKKVGDNNGRTAER